MWVALEILRHAGYVCIILSPRRGELCGADGLQGEKSCVRPLKFSVNGGSEVAA